MNITNINGLHSSLLGEIISRLSCYKLVSQCKCVSKHWRAFISEPSFTRGFLLLQIEKQPLKTATLINIRGEELHSGMSSPLSSSLRLTQLLKRLVSLYGLRTEPIVVGAYNDLVLCSSPHENHGKYFICNPYTMHWIALPPLPTQYPIATVVGLICDMPYYNSLKGTDGKMDIRFTADYKFRVVRMFWADHYHPTNLLSETKVEIFSSETGEWSERVAICPEAWEFMYSSIAHNGVLYHLCQLNSKTCLAGLDPFMIMKTIKNSSTTTTSNDLDCCKCCLVEMDTDVVDDFNRDQSVISQRSMRVSYFDWDSFSACTWDLKEEGKMWYKHTGVYSLDRDMAPEESIVVTFELIAIDPNDDGIVYLDVNGDLVMCNIETREWSVVARQCQTMVSHIYKLELPLWPTPIPKIGQHANKDQGTSNSSS